MRILLATVLLGFAAIAVGASAAPQLAVRDGTAARTAADCHAVKFIAVRGSGDTLNDFGVLGGKISGALARRAKSLNVDYGAYGLPYPAVGIDWWSFTGNGTAIKLVSYNLSKNKGRDNLRAFIKKELSPSVCPNERLVLEGYSQGAHVVGDVLSKKVGGLTAKELSHIKAVVLIADPRFNSQEPFVRGYSNYRTGRNGVLGARSPGDLSSVAGKIRGWCRKDDLVCQGPGTTGNHAQAKYWADYGNAIVDYIAAALVESGTPVQRLVFQYGNSIATLPLSGGTPKRIVRGVYASALAASATTIYWSTGGEQRVIWQVPLHGGTPRRLIAGVTAGYLTVGGGYVYWAEKQVIGRVRVDGTGRQSALISVTLASTVSEPAEVNGLATDGRYVYFASCFGGAVGRASMDGTGAAQRFITLPSRYCAQSLAVNGKYLYFTDLGSGTNSGVIGRGSINGREVNPFWYRTVNDELGPYAVTGSGASLYWGHGESTASGRSYIGKMRTDATGVQDEWLVGGMQSNTDNTYIGGTGLSISG